MSMVFKGGTSCSYCGAFMGFPKLKTPSGRNIYVCPDCMRRQFADGSAVPPGVITLPADSGQKKEASA